MIYSHVVEVKVKQNGYSGIVVSVLATGTQFRGIKPG
jgi:hypothetical protein